MDTLQGYFEWDNWVLDDNTSRPQYHFWPVRVVCNAYGPWRRGDKLLGITLRYTDEKRRWTLLEWDDAEGSTFSNQVPIVVFILD